MRTFNMNGWVHWKPRWKALALNLTLSQGPVFSGGIRLIWWSCDWAIGWWKKSHFPNWPETEVMDGED